MEPHLEHITAPASAEPYRRSVLAVIGMLGASAAARRASTPVAISRRREEAEVELMEARVAARRFDTTERRVRLFWHSIFCFLTAVLIGTAVYCCLQGSQVTIPAVTGPLGIAAGIGSYVAWPNRKVDDPWIGGSSMQSDHLGDCLALKSRSCAVRGLCYSLLGGSSTRSSKGRSCCRKSSFSHRATSV